MGEILVVFLDLNVVLQNSRGSIVFTDVSKSKRFAVLTELSASFSVQNILEPLFEVLFSERGSHDWKDSSQRIDQDDWGESWIEVELVLEFLMITSLSPQKADWFISEIVNDLKSNKSYSFDSF